MIEVHLLYVIPWVFSCSSDLTIKHDKIRTELELRGEVQMAEIELELRKRGEVEAQVGNSSKILDFQQVLLTGNSRRI